MSPDRVAATYQRFGHLVLDRCRRLLADDGVDADEAMVETFARLAAQGDTFPDGAGQLLWLHRVAEQVCCERPGHRPGSLAGRLATQSAGRRRGALLQLLDGLTVAAAAVEAGTLEADVAGALRELGEEAPPPRGDHPPRIVVVRFSADDLAVEAAPQLAAHLAACADCRAAGAPLGEAREALLRRLPPEQLVRRVLTDLERRLSVQLRRLRRRAVIGALLAAAAVATFLLLRPRAADEPVPVGPALAVERLRGATRTLLVPDDRLRPGDRLAVLVRLEERHQVAVWRLDGRGRLDRLFEEGARALEAGEHAGERAFTVEAPCAETVFVIAFDDQATGLTEAKLQRAVSRGLPSGGDFAPPGSSHLRFACEPGTDQLPDAAASAAPARDR